VVDGACGGSGGQRRDGSARGGASGVGQAAGGRAGGQVAQEEQRGGSWRPGEMPLMCGERRCRETERGKQEEEDEDLFINFAKVQGVYCQVKFSSNYSSNENMPKIKSVELRKIYHFALGSNFKRVRVLKLFLKANDYSISNKSKINITFSMKPWSIYTSYSG
jgi:hypothetical protein